MMYMAAMMGQTGCKLIMVNSAWDGEGGGGKRKLDTNLYSVERLPSLYNKQFESANQIAQIVGGN